MGTATTALSGIDQQVKTIGGSTKDFGTSLADAFRVLPPVVQATDSELQNMAFALRNVAPIAEEAGEMTKHALREAKGEAGLLGEMFGIHLPRHVRTFIAEIPGVGSALSAAFAATAVLFIIEALAQGIEKIIEMAHHSEKIAEAWKKVDDGADLALRHIGDEILKVEAHIDELHGNHMGALQKQLELLGHTSLAGLAGEIEKIQKDVDAAFVETKTWWDYLTTFGQGNAGVSATKKDFDEITKHYQDLLKTGDRLGAFAALESGADAAKKKIQELTEQQDKFKTALVFSNDQSGNQQIKDQIAVMQLQIDARKRLAKSLDDYRQLQEQSNKLEQDQTKVDRTETQAKVLSDLAANEKAALKERLANIEMEKNVQHQAFEDKKITAQQWADAQIKATMDTLKAQSDYEAKVIQFAAKESDLNKGSVAARNAATEGIERLNKAFETAANGVDKAQSETAKLRAEMEKLVFPAEKAKEQAQAFKELEAAEHKLADTRKDLALAGVSGDFKEQESAIRRVTQLRIVSKQQEAALLLSMEKAEAAAELKILQDDLAEKEKALNAARVRFAAASKDALFPPAELAALKTNLDTAEIEWNKAQTKILHSQTTANARMLTLDRGYYGAALTLALAFGNKKLAEQLKENHESQITAQNQLKEAKDRKENTKSIEDQIKALQRSERELFKEASAVGSLHAMSGKLFSTRANWESYFAALTSGAMKTGEAFRELGKEVVASFAQSVEAALSGSQGFGEAMQQMLKSALAALAAHAIVKVAEELAFAASDLANPFMAWHAPFHFHAAAMWGAVGLGAAVGAVAIPGGSSSGSSKGLGSGSNAPATVAPGASQQPVLVQNVQHFAAGGLISSPTLAVVGDNRSGGGAREAILPLDDHRAIAAIAQAIAAHGGGGEIHIRLESDIPHVARLISSGVKRGSIRLTASDSIRHTKRS